MSPLSEGRCRELLTSQRSGRLALTRRALPVIEPVQYCVVDGDVIIRTASGTSVGDALPGAVVALEADEWNDAPGTGWTVLVQGEATRIDDEAERHALERLGLDAWTDARDRDLFVRLHPTSVNGYAMDRVERIETVDGR